MKKAHKIHSSLPDVKTCKTTGAERKEKGKQTREIIITTK
jgi:hypothetical protein